MALFDRYPAAPRPWFVLSPSSGWGGAAAPGWPLLVAADPHRDLAGLVVALMAVSAADASAPVRPAEPRVVH
jgi:hypothetical protein